MKNDFTVGSPAKSILLFSLPMLIGNIFQQLYSTVDGIVVGRYVGKNALAAISGTWSSVMLVLALAMGFANGISVVISQLYGAKDYNKLKRAFSTTVLMGAAFTVALSLLGLLVSRPLLMLLKIPDEIFADALLYVQIGFATLFGSFMYNGFSGVLRAIGDSKTPLYFLIIASVTNIVLDLLFVVGFQWGVAGAAIATAAGQILSGVLCTIYIVRMDIFSIPKGEWVLDMEMVRAIGRYGIPAAIQMAVFSLGMMAIQGLVNSFGTDMIAAFSAANRVEDFAEMPLMNLATALSMYVGQNIGAGMQERARKGLRSTLLMMTAICGVMLLFIPFIARNLIQLFVQETEVLVIETGVRSINFLTFFFLVFSINQVTANFLRGAGDSVYSMFTSFVTLLVRLPIAYYLASIPSIGYMAIWYSLPCGWAASGIFTTIRYFSGRWKTKGLRTSKNAGEEVPA